MMLTVIEALLSNAVVAIILALMAFAGERLFPARPALRHSLWLLVLLKLVTPPLFAIPLPTPEGSFVPEIVELPPVSAAPLEVVLSPVEAQDEAITSYEETKSPPILPEASKAFDWSLGALVAWWGGAVVWWTWVIIRSWRFCVDLRKACPASEALAARVGQLAVTMGLKEVPRIVFLSGCIAPSLWAFGRRATLLLPLRYWDKLTEAQREAVLVHEMAHLKRRDHWVRVLEVLVLGLFWWHPVAWWARSGLHRAEEECCDAWVLWALPQRVEDYATALVEAAAFLSPEAVRLPVAASGMGQLNGLKRRLNMMINGRPARCLSRAGRVGVVALALVALPFLYSWSEAPADEPSLPAVGEFDETTPSVTEDPPPPATRLRRSVSEPLPTDPARIPSDSEESRRIRDEIELLEVQREGEAAQLQVVETGLKYAEMRRKSLGQLGGVVSQQELLKAQETVDSLTAQAAVQKAKVREAEIKLQQARRRLERASTQSTPPGAGWSASRLFKSLSHDFGQVNSRSELTWSASLVNPTEQTYRIAKVTTSSAALKAEARSVELNPGEQGTIAVRLDPSRVVGSQGFRVIVEFSHPHREQVALVLSATVSDSGTSGTSPGRSASPRASGRTGSSSGGLPGLPPAGSAGSAPGSGGLPVRPSLSTGSGGALDARGTGLPPPGTSTGSDQDRIRQLEAQLDQLKKEIDTLRGTLRRTDPIRR